jgi:exopolysaccharide biosynthesis polyprenyl glycosylphosphotransferase
MDANFLGLSVARAELEDFDGWSVLTFSSTPADVEALVIKRVVDVALSALALVVLSPLLLLVVILVRIDGGPALFSQERSGLYGKTFRMWKFRSMVVDAEDQRAALEAQNEMTGPVFKIAHDPRVTRLGAFLRRSSIDELPQLWNVVRGDMSLVGPRPALPSEAEQWEGELLNRLRVRPGITGMWQVYGRDNEDFSEYERLDLFYIDNWSILTDLAIILRTVMVVINRTGS